MKLTLRADTLAEALSLTVPFAGTDKMLPALVAVRIVPTDSGVVFLATDRYVLAEYRAEHDVRVDNPESEGFGVPLDTAKQWLKMAKAAARYPQEAQIIFEDGRVILTVNGETVNNAASEDRWVPNYDRLFPANPGETPLGEIGFSSHLIATLGKAFKRGQPLRFAMGATEVKPVTVTAPTFESWRAIIMPVRLAA